MVSENADHNSCRFCEGAGNVRGPIRHLFGSRNPDVIRVEFGLDEKYIVEISETVGKMQLNEVIALMLVFGQQRFVAGPMMILADLVTECNLE